MSDIFCTIIITSILIIIILIRYAYYKTQDKFRLVQNM